MTYFSECWCNPQGPGTLVLPDVTFPTSHRFCRTSGVAAATPRMKVTGILALNQLDGTQSCRRLPKLFRISLRQNEAHNLLKCDLEIIQTILSVMARQERFKSRSQERAQRTKKFDQNKRSKNM